MLARVAVEDDVVGGYLMPSGTYVLLSQYMIHRDPRLWDNPDRFEPERFLEANKERLPKRAYFPFSIGQRKCIGDNFAKMEAKLALATILQQISPVLLPNHPVKMDTHVTLRPRHGMWMRLERRT